MSPCPRPVQTPPSILPSPSGSSSQGTAMSAPSNQTVVPTTSAIGIFTPIPQIEKLKDGNWFAWKTRIAIVLKRNEAYEIVTGAEPQPQDPSAADWKVKDLFAQELITTTIKDEQIAHLFDCKSDAEMWEALCTVHERDQLFSMQRALYTAVAEEGTDIATHLMKMKVLRMRLSLAGHRIDDVEFQALLASSLPRTAHGSLPYAASRNKRQKI